MPGRTALSWIMHKLGQWHSERARGCYCGHVSTAETSWQPQQRHSDCSMLPAPAPREIPAQTVEQLEQFFSQQMVQVRGS